jgi:23S rRNA (cytidine1920-2'-O)/16S rRNA (cytidine1409-2'-O)-methyltransferase
VTAPSANRERLDKLLVSRGLEESRERAQRRILAGEVVVDQHRVDKPGTLVRLDAEITLSGEQNAYVSRGGLKLEAALDHWQLDVHDLDAADIGASTGGFTDCLLQRGARGVLAIDVGYGQFAWKLRQDPRVRLLERTNVRALDPEPLRTTIDLAAIDVSFISLRLVLPNVLAMMRHGGRILPLVKPQFEVGKHRIGTGGVVRDPQLRREAVDGIRDFAVDLGLVYLGALLSPVIGPKGNREFFLHLQVPGSGPAEPLR